MERLLPLDLLSEHSFGRYESTIRWLDPGDREMRRNVSYPHHSVDVNLQSGCFGLSVPPYKRILCRCRLRGVSRGRLTLIPDRENVILVQIALKIKLILQGAW